MRSLYTLAVVLALAGCGDDSTGPADMAMALDQGMASADCAGYCAQMEQVCVAGDGSQAVTPPYLSSSDCMDFCANVARWSDGAAGGDTLTCRKAAVAQAAGGSDVAAHCDAAGPTGNNVCGSWCENLCGMMLKNCSGANQVYDAATCMTKCATMPASGKPGDVTGNTVQCRIYHMGVAFHDPVTHCPHGKTLADNPSGPCQ
jgi:hypothetical protein